MKNREFLYICIALVMALGLACTPTSPNGDAASSPSGVVSSSSPNASTEASAPTSTLATTQSIPVTGHLMTPTEVVPLPGKMIDDVESSGTGPEGRAPYGDSYKLNRFERPFLQDMTYVADIDIHKFGLSEDADWYYVSIQLMGTDPNNAPGIHYGAEIDLDGDGFGDYILWTKPPYTPQWDTSTVQVFQDSNRDSGGLSALKSDAVSDGDGYDTLVFDGSSSENADPDLAWVRTNEDRGTTLQIAFKKSLTGSAFMLGVVSDAGLKDVSKFDYADHIAEANAGSSVQNNPYYPLGELYAVDNTCWEAYGMQTTGYEPKLCQPILQPVNTQSPDEDEPALACNPPPDCNGDEPGTGDFDPVTCICR
jgi:hypothetical protein